MLTTVARRRTWGAEAVALATALVGAAALCRLVGAGLTGPVGWPVFAAAAAGCAAPAASLRRRASPALAVAGGTVVAALVDMWTTLPGATRVGVPTATTLRIVRTDLRAARGVLSGFALPLHASAGVILLASLLAGVAAVLGRTAYGSPRLEAGRGAPALALVPSAGLVVWSCIALPTRSAVALVAALVTAGSLTVAGARPAGEATPRARPPRRAGTLLLPACGLAATVVIGLSVGITSAASSGSSGSGSGRDATVAPTSLSLASDVVGLERQDPAVVLFRAQTPVPTYWQEGTLTDWDGSGWQPDAATNDALDGRPGPAAAPALRSPGGRTFALSVTMAALSTRLLPVPPMTTRVSAPGGAVITSVGADATRPSTRGERYTATATVPGSVADTSAPSDGSVLTSAQLAPYVALPPVSPVVTSTARQVTAVARTPLGRAEALVDWFRSGIFTYTLSPPPSPLGADPLVRFLATTRAGTCESFASAYAVMARSVGLPTRIAVGFTTGRVTAPGVTTVRGKDAHEWPEVYLGAGAGWVSFEPTPQLPSGELTPPGVVGPTGITLPPSSTPTTAHTSVPPTTPTTQPVPTSATTQPSSSAASTPTRSPVGHASSAWWLATTAVVIVVAAGVAVRRVRRRRPASAPAVRVRRANERADRALARAAMVRPPGRTLGAHADALGTLLERAPAPGTARHLAARDQLLTALRDLRIVGDALENAFYRPTSVGPGEALEAEEAQRRVTRALRHRPVRAVAARLETGARAPASR